MNFDLDLSIDVLARTPATLHALLDGLTEPWTRATEGPNTFSPFDVVGHLIDGEETDWIPRARIILARGTVRRFERYDRFRHRTRNVDGRSYRCSTSSPGCEPIVSRSCDRGTSRQPSWTCQANIHHSVPSRSASCSRRGSCTISVTSRRRCE